MAPCQSGASVVCDMPRYSLSDKVVLITGAGRGLGAATATALAQRGARVVLADVDVSGAQRVAATLPNSRGLALTCDVTDIDSVHEAVRRTHEEFGRVDVAIANAGILGRGGTFRTLTSDQIGGVVSVNVNGVVNTVAATLESVISSRGQIVLVSSVFAYINGAGAIPYAMSKAAVEQLGRGLGVELASHGASAMTAYFSLIETDMIRQGVDADPHVSALLSAMPKVHAQANPTDCRGRRDCRRPGTQATLHHGPRPLEARRSASRRGRTDRRRETRARRRRTASAYQTREPLVRVRDVVPGLG
jgi:NAD(P)-dependent dehydrogenase (short-subunit alcohol dehydrogenase family)